MGQIAPQLSQQVQGNLSSNAISNPTNHERFNFVTTITQKDKLTKPEIKLHYPQRLKRGVIKKELHVSQHAQWSTSSTIFTNSIYHINVTAVTIRSQKVAEDENDKATNVEHFIEVGLKVRENKKEAK